MKSAAFALCTIGLLICLPILVPAVFAGGTGGDGGGTGGDGGGSGGFEFTVPNPLGCTGAADGPPILCLWNRIYAFIWQLAFPVATIMILVGAWQILTAAGDPKKFETGRKTILYTVIGLAIVLVAGSLPLLIQDILTNDPR